MQYKCSKVRRNAWPSEKARVEFVGSPSFVGMRTDAAMYMLIHGYNDMVFATAHYFDDRDPSTETEAWQNWLGGLAA